MQAKMFRILSVADAVSPGTYLLNTLQPLFPGITYLVLHIYTVFISYLHLSVLLPTATITLENTGRKILAVDISLLLKSQETKK